MKLAVSNIAWPADADEEVWTTLRDLGVGAIEVAPNRVFPGYVGADAAGGRAYAAELARHGLACSSLQAILFDKPELSIFGDDATKEATRTHLAQMADLAVALGGAPVVFGAPKNRDRGARSRDEAKREAVEFFRAVAEDYARAGAVLCLEPNPPEYGSNFVLTSAEGAEVVRAVGSNGFALHLDAACMHLVGEDAAAAVERSADVLRHVHVSEPNLGDFRAPRCDHRRFGDALRRVGYAGFVVVEMRATAEPAFDVRTAVETTRSFYG